MTATASTAESTTRSVKARIDCLKMEGVDIRLGIDLQKIDKQFANQRFKRIHWICPYGNPLTGMKSEAFVSMIGNCFSTSHKMQ